ncbi:hypothetical protein B0T26DRAFT_737317 [Lasiosphaeria miniovina]|uniref:SET domain-containing protein n=1 Tax=Lasiosphaeria miniovina TaxID=1954250 RepID=A0AA40BIM3_9PEZI|nr:uncharacterized protein B0T26DRAFT_737317 [Lasiosphaeria miniovina]KAK0734768.1 hypothetical protein B0T26DRAFT_737317 [Lasiosphaeria miniovina]
MRHFVLSLCALVVDSLVAAEFHPRSDAAAECPLSTLLDNDATCAAPRLSAHRPEGDGRVEGEDRNPLLPPGWEGPSDCIREWCVFWNPELNGGIALVTTLAHAQLATSYPQVADDADASSPLPFEPTPIPGKGTGLVATRAIRKGDIIMQRTATLVAQDAAHFRLPPNLRNDLYQRAVDKLPAPRRAAFLTQIGADVYTKIDRNSFRLVFVNGSAAAPTNRDDKTAAHLGCFNDVHFFNHDCRPNTHYRITNLTHTTVAVQDIAAGDELTISYVDATLQRAERQKRLSDWGFECTCKQCSLPPREVLESDLRLQAMDWLSEELEDKVTTVGGLVELEPAMGARLVALYEQERLHAYLGHAYTRAALVYSMFEDADNAKKYAADAEVAMLREYGPANKDAVAMRALAADPENHWSWGIVRRAG